MGDENHKTIQERPKEIPEQGRQDSQSFHCPANATETGTVTREYKPHLLAGEYNGFMECHVENDLLLIWLDETENIIKLVRLGTHSELFR